MMMIGYGFALLTMAPFIFVKADTPAYIIILLLLARSMPFRVRHGGGADDHLRPARELEAGPGFVGLQHAPPGGGLVRCRAVWRPSLSAATKTHISEAVASQHLGNATAAVSKHASELGFRDGFIVAALMMAVPLVLTVFVNDKEAAEQLKVHARPVDVDAGAVAEGAPARAGASASH